MATARPTQTSPGAACSTSERRRDILRDDARLPSRECGLRQPKHRPIWHWPFFPLGRGDCPHERFATEDEGMTRSGKSATHLLREIMKPTASTRFVLTLFSASALLAGCSAALPRRTPAPEMRAEVSWSPQGTPEGSYTLYNSRGAVQATGEFLRGQREGTWTFWASTGARVVEVTYRNGIKDGPCRMWYGPFAYPRSDGTKKLEVDFSNDLQNGLKRTWWPDGSAKCDAELNRGSVARARCWSNNGVELSPAKALEAARDQLAKDREYLRVLDDVVEESLQRTSTADTRGSPPPSP